MFKRSEVDLKEYWNENGECEVTASVLLEKKIVVYGELIDSPEGLSQDFLKKKIIVAGQFIYAPEGFSTDFLKKKAVEELYCDTYKDLVDNYSRLVIELRHANPNEINALLDEHRQYINDLYDTMKMG